MTDRRHRPRTTYTTANRLEDLATELNGAEPAGFHDALVLVLDYVTLLDGRGDCPGCGTALRQFRHRGAKVRGKYRCPECHERDECIDAFDVLDVTDRDSASLPVLPSWVTAGDATRETGSNTVKRFTQARPRQ